MPWQADINWTDSKLDFLSQVFDNIIDAVNERCKAAGVAVVSDGVNDIESGATFLHETFTIGNAIDTKLTELIPFYADQTQATGTEFIGLDSLPAWTEANLLIDIYPAPGDRVRILADKLGYISTEWIEQVYEITNRLLWSLLSFGPSDREYRNIDYPNWGSSSWQNGFSINQIHLVGMISDSNNQTRQACTFTISKPTVLFNSSVDVYLLNAATLPGFAWNDEGLGYVENEIRLLESFASDALTPKVTAKYGRIDTAPPSPPIAGQYEGWQSNAHKAVLKWDVVGGFDYVA